MRFDLVDLQLFVAVADSGSITAGHYDESIVYDDAWDPGDDLPYTKRQIRHWVQQGVAAELSARRTKTEILRLVSQVVAAEAPTRWNAPVVAAPSAPKLTSCVSEPVAVIAPWSLPLP